MLHKSNKISRHLIRRTAFRVASSSPSTSFVSQSRSINTCSPFLLRSKIQAISISPSVFRRFASDDASSPSSADGEHSSVSSAVDSAAESASTYASETAGSVSYSAQEAKDTVVDAAAGTAAAAGYAFQPREDRRVERPYGGRSSDFGGPRGFDRDRSNLPEIIPSPSIYIGNLLFEITAQDLEREFGEFGEIKSSIIATDPRGMSKG